jgi:hypothetical protein
MSRQSEVKGFAVAPLFMLFLPHAAISYFCAKSDLWPAGGAAAIVITGLCLVFFVARNWADLLAGVLGSFLLIALLAACAMIPVVGWIADVLIVLYALGSVFASIGALLPYALKGAAIWTVFLVSLLPAVFHPVASPLVIFLLCLGLGSALGKKASPFDEFILLMSSIPLFAMAVASLGKLFQSGIVMRNAQFQQNVSGYTTRAGVQVGDYTRTVTKVTPTLTTSVNPGAVAIGSSAGRTPRDEPEA